jgi:CRISPR/Cas system-associated exonuclease Cas4 (RecB family)
MSPQEIKWSYSGLKDYSNCPKQYHEVKVLKRFSKRPTQEMLYGTQVHTALENYVKDGSPLAKNYERYKKQLDPLREMDGIKYPEHRMAITYDKEPCTFGAKNYWARGIADLLVVDDDQGFIVDYKTGSNKYPDPKQLQLMALMAFAHFPELQHIKAGLLFVAHEHFVTSEYSREKIDEYWQDFYWELERMRLSHENGSWQANPTPLCGWCPVHTCEYHKER